ncbi:hypothetical protein D3C73_1355750 [compost metagenome]
MSSPPECFITTAAGIDTDWPSSRTYSTVHVRIVASSIFHRSWTSCLIPLMHEKKPVSASSTAVRPCKGSALAKLKITSWARKLFTNPSAFIASTALKISLIFKAILVSFIVLVGNVLNVLVSNGVHIKITDNLFFKGNNPFSTNGVQ